ncbi:MAG: hypothetical protein RLZZ574_644 [Cyanobacteriota bacterium]|jgi:hypothetical protein
MTTSSPNLNLNHGELSTPQIDLVATVKLPPEHFIQSHQLKFIPSSDDLDSLIFTSFNLPSGTTIPLVRHQNSPCSGVEIYLPPNLPSPNSVFAEVMHFLNLSHDDLDWIHPQINLALLNRALLNREWIC